jgi:hypothetical protein
MKVAKFTGIIFACLLTLTVSVVSAGDDIELSIESGKALIQTASSRCQPNYSTNCDQRKDEVKDHPRHAEAWYLFSISLRKLSYRFGG